MFLENPGKSFKSGSWSLNGQTFFSLFSKLIKLSCLFVLIQNSAVKQNLRLCEARFLSRSNLSLVVFIVKIQPTQ